MLKKFVCFFLLLYGCIGLSTSVIAQKLTYKIFFNNSPVGMLIAERHQQKENVSYLLQSQMVVQKIINVSVDYKLESTFTEGKMVQSIAYQKINRKVQVNSATKWDGIQYNIQTLDGSSAIKKKSINHNMCTIYYYEPVGLTQIFSDAFGRYLNIRPLGNHRYELTLPDGKKSYYNYASGICFQVESEQLFSKIIFRLAH